jgi:putative transposase
MRRIQFENECFYHVYNRGVDKRAVFNDKFDYLRFLESIREFNRLDPAESLERQRYLKRNPQPEAFQKASGCLLSYLVEVICYVLMPNHYHLLLKQNTEKGISKFMQKLSMGYTNYFNLKNNRSGYLFQGTYKAIQIRTGDKLNQLSAYIHGNPEIHGIAKAENWIWSSFWII